ncbi:hypothetical protein ACVW1C_001899 [Bradyrhizobium sp. USDA 4011]
MTRLPHPPPTVSHPKTPIVQCSTTAMLGISKGF